MPSGAPSPSNLLMPPPSNGLIITSVLLRRIRSKTRSSGRDEALQTPSLVDGPVGVSIVVASAVGVSIGIGRVVGRLLARLSIEVRVGSVMLLMARGRGRLVMLVVGVVVIRVVIGRALTPPVVLKFRRTA